MYSINQTTIIDENGKIFKTYGITCENRTIKDISIDKKKVEQLVELCNKNKLSPLHLDDIIDDFLVDLQI